MKDYGDYGKPVLLFEAYEEWREDPTATDTNGRLLSEADSKADFAEFLFGPIRTSLYQGYERVQPQYKRYTRAENMPDFRERRIKGLTGMTKPGYVGDHGEYPGMGRGERPSASLVIDTYGGVYGLTRQAIINDESNELLNSAPTEMGDAAAEFIVETIVALVESNPTAPDGNPFFDNTTHGNDGTAALSEDALVDAVAAMTRKTDDTGRRIRVSIRTLLVGHPKLQLIADRIINSQVTGTTVNYTGGTPGIGSAYFDKGTRNVVQGIVPNDAVVYDPYLTDANDWYLFADPARVPAFAVGFLNGQENPQVFLKNPEVRSALGGGGQDPYTFELDSIDWKVRLDFGAAPVDPRGAYRSKVT